jgi:hypothetical protein
MRRCAPPSSFPDALFREVKARAALEGRTLKALLAESVERGLERSARFPAAGARRRSDPPLFVPAAGAGETLPFRTNAELDEMLLRAEIERNQTFST